MSSTDDGFALSNNILSMQRALEEGMRGLMLDLVPDGPLSATESARLVAQLSASG